MPASGIMRFMYNDEDRAEAKKVIRELRTSASKLILRSREMAEEALRLKRRADDLDQLIKQRDLRGKK